MIHDFVLIASNLLTFNDSSDWNAARLSNYPDAIRARHAAGRACQSRWRKDLRSKLLYDCFAIGPDASAAWGNGAPAPGDPNAKILSMVTLRGSRKPPIDDLMELREARRNHSRKSPAPLKPGPALLQRPPLQIYPAPRRRSDRSLPPKSTALA